MKVVLELF